jgi:hypothetical protein
VQEPGPCQQSERGMDWQAEMMGRWPSRTDEQRRAVEAVAAYDRHALGREHEITAEQFDGALKQARTAGRRGGR